MSLYSLDTTVLQKLKPIKNTQKNTKQKDDFNLGQIVDETVETTKNGEKPKRAPRVRKPKVPKTDADVSVPVQEVPVSENVDTAVPEKPITKKVVKKRTKKVVEENDENKENIPPVKKPRVKKAPVEKTEPVQKPETVAKTPRQENQKILICLTVLDKS